MRLGRIAISTTVAMLAMAGAAFGQAAHASASGTVVTTHHTALGTILVTSSGQTLYLDSSDKPGQPACTGSCLTIWPALKTSGAPMAAGGAKAADLGTVKGAGGVTQVTYKGHPLYTFASDSKSKPTSGEGVGGFFVVSPSGAKIAKSSSAPAATGSPAPSW